MKSGGIVTRPVGRSVHSGNLAAVLVDKHCYRQPECQVLALQVIEHAHRGIAVELQRFDADLAQERLGLCIVTRIDIDRHDLEVIAALFRLQRIERRHFFAARQAPCCPKIDEQRLALEIREPHRLAVWRGESQF